MNAEKFTYRGTLGPSRAEHLLGPCVIENEAGKQIAILSGRRSDHQVAIARLLASAPELLAALQDAEQRMHSYLILLKCDEEFIDLETAQQRAAIAKATGSNA